MAQYIIGVDIGTTSTKTILFDIAGTAHAKSNQGYPLIQDAVGMAEQAPAQILQAVYSGIRAVTAAIAPISIVGIAFSAAMHSLILLDDQQQPLTRSITWADNRATAAAAKLKAMQGATTRELRTGVPTHPMTPLSKLVWLRETRPELMQQAKYIVGIKEYVLLQLTGQLVTDYSLAGATGMFNLSTCDWDDATLHLAGITRMQLPQLVPTTKHLAGLTVAASKETGLPQNTPVIVGASDGCLSNLGLGAINPGDVALTIGTSGAVRTACKQPVPTAGTFTYYLAPNLWIQGGPTNNGGNVLQWLDRSLFPDFGHDYPRLLETVGSVPAGSHHLLCLPFFSGERAPIWDWNARASFIGLTATHTRADMARAALEGVAFNLRAILLRTSRQPKRILATGGFAQSKQWAQLLADSLGQPIQIPDNYDSSALGAAILGLNSLGLLSGLKLPQTTTAPTTIIKPNPVTHTFYAAWFALWQEAVAQTATINHAIARLRN